MKYQRLVSVGLAALSASTASASPFLMNNRAGQCPPGYSPSVYYITVTAEPTVVAPTTASVEPTSTVEVTTEPVPVESAPSAAGTTTISPEAPPAEVYAPPVLSPTSSSQVIAVVPPVEIEPTSTTAPAPVTTTTELQPTTTTTIITTTTTTTTTTSTTTTTTEAAPTSSSSDSQSAVTGGKATFYGGNVSGGTCSFTGYTLPSSLFGTAFSGAIWDDAAHCGSCVAVTGPSGNTIKAMIVDKCPECESDHLDLFEDAFAQLADTSEGVISIDWSYVSCDIDTPFVLKNKEGTSQYWFSMQVVNANEPIVSLEVSTDGGSTWQGTTRSFYNYFENSSGFGTETVDVRVTGESGKRIVVKSVGCSSGSSTTASGNF